ncbi:MAG TPA: hypothetical protein VGX23_28555 [Actinocrinis sp.]|nr:hypothetical protein [Actinocrinis sp.]
MSATTIGGRRDADEDGPGGRLRRMGRRGWLEGLGQLGWAGGVGTAQFVRSAAAVGFVDSDDSAESIAGAESGASDSDLLAAGTAASPSPEALADLEALDALDALEADGAPVLADPADHALPDAQGAPGPSQAAQGGTRCVRITHSARASRSDRIVRHARHARDLARDNRLDLVHDQGDALDDDVIRADGAGPTATIGYTYLPDRAQFVIGPSLVDQLSAVLARVWAMVRRWDKTTRLLAGSAVALVPWIIVLGLTLPTHTVARNWSTVWIGFDLLLAAAFGVTARLYLRNDPRVGIMAAVVATLLIVDCWFDTSTASEPRDAIESWAMAVLVEIPIAVFCARLAWRSSLSMVGPPPTAMAAAATAVPAQAGDAEPVQLTSAVQPAE